MHGVPQEDVILISMFPILVTIMTYTKLINDTAYTRELFVKSPTSFRLNRDSHLRTAYVAQDTVQI